MALVPYFSILGRIKPQPSVTLPFSINHISSRCWFHLFGWIKSPVVPYLSQYLRESSHTLCSGVWKKFLVFICYFWTKKDKTTGFFNEIWQLYCYGTVSIMPGVFTLNQSLWNLIFLRYGYGTAKMWLFGTAKFT